MTIVISCINIELNIVYFFFMRHRLFRLRNNACFEISPYTFRYQTGKLLLARVLGLHESNFVVDRFQLVSFFAVIHAIVKLTKSLSETHNLFLFDLTFVLLLINKLNLMFHLLLDFSNFILVFNDGFRLESGLVIHIGSHYVLDSSHRFLVLLPE